MTTKQANIDEHFEPAPAKHVLRTIDRMRRRLSKAIHGNGVAVIGRIATTSTVNTATITLDDPNDAARIATQVADGMFIANIGKDWEKVLTSAATLDAVIGFATVMCINSSSSSPCS